MIVSYIYLVEVACRSLHAGPGSGIWASDWASESVFTSTEATVGGGCVSDVVCNSKYSIAAIIHLQWFNIIFCTCNNYWQSFGGLHY